MRKMQFVGSLSLLLLLGAREPAGPSTRLAGGEARAVAFDTVVERAKAQLLERYPDHPGTHPWNFKQSAQVTRYESHWLVTWLVPENVTGGGPLVKLDRRTLEFRSVQFQQ